MSFISIKKIDTIEEKWDIPSESIDLIVTSPPYWKCKNYTSNTQLGQEESYSKFLNKLEKCFIKCVDVLKSDSMLIFIVADIAKKPDDEKKERTYIIPYHADIINGFINLGLHFFRHIIWEKHAVRNMKPHGSIGTRKYAGLTFPRFVYPNLITEHVLVFHKPGKRKNLDYELLSNEALSSMKTTLASKWMNPIWIIPTVTDHNHPAPFPEELVYRLIRLYSSEKETIFDPFCGRGTTSKVSLLLKRNAIGYELNDNYIEYFLKKYIYKPNKIKSEEILNSIQLKNEISDYNNYNSDVIILEQTKCI